MQQCQVNFQPIYQNKVRQVLIILQSIQVKNCGFNIEKLKIIQSKAYIQKLDEIPIFSNLNYKIAICSLWRDAPLKEQIIFFSKIISQIQCLVINQTRGQM
ncbi:unnamed protein product [Paramecium sonneborni]|uniref:Uncharacterized protein n=1 Tax=Paramecium sonneborni TaxID=65129 RepID=A0A8S1RL27_9CILI|nr:unnamed protein product [Paramecium sonneborni]